LALSGISSAQANSDWCTVEAMGFEVISDLEPAKLGEVLDDLKRFETWATDYLPGTASDLKVPMRMLIFSSHRAFRHYFGSRNFAGFLQPSLSKSTVVIAPHRGKRLLLKTARHEYSHYLLRNRLDVSLPMWFDEGLASLLSNIVVESSQVILGRLPIQTMQTLTTDSSRRTLSIAQVINSDQLLDWSQDRINQFYNWSWLLTHYLMLNGPERKATLDAYLEERTAPLFDYLGYSNNRLERRLRRYVRGTPAQVTETYPPAQPTQLKPRCLNELERDLALAAAVVEHNPSNALELVQAHLQSHPEDPRLLVLVSRAHSDLGDQALSIEIAQQAQALAPDNAEVLVNLGNRLTSDCMLRRGSECRDTWRTALPLYRRALEIDVERFDAVFGIGLAYLHGGRAGEAVNYLKVVYARAPWAVPVNFYLGESYRIIGDARAQLYLNNARNWAQNPLWRQLADMALAELER
jgi:tetratricopeptide (TPR) repeat protein